MPFASIYIPTLVQTTLIDEKEHYQIRPLFLHAPMVVHRRFSGAESKFKKELKTHFKRFRIHRDNANQLLWFFFHPELNFKTKRFAFTVNKQYLVFY